MNSHRVVSVEIIELMTSDLKLVRHDIAQFEKNQKWISPAGDAALLSRCVFLKRRRPVCVWRGLARHVCVCVSSGHVMSTDEREQWNREYMENIRLRLGEDSIAREQREMRRRRALVEQLQAHQTQQVSTVIYLFVSYD